MQIFVNCLGDTKCFNVGADIEVLKSEIQKEFGIENNINLYSFCGKIENLEELSELNNQTVEALIEVLGGGKGGKKKKKVYSTPKKNKHRHKNTKLMALSYYAIKKDGTVERVKKLCEQESCKEQGVFMANHWNRYYCGKCHHTLKKKDAPAVEPKRGKK
jgi:small subunit ribosomal protein S27Ae